MKQNKVKPKQEKQKEKKLLAEKPPWIRPPLWKIVAVTVTVLLAIASLATVGFWLHSKYRETYWRGIRNEGEEHLQAGNFEEARIRFQKLLQHDDRNYLALYYKGRCDIELGEQLEGFRCIRMAADLKPDFHPAQAVLVGYYLVRGDIINARKRAELAARAQRAPVQALSELASIYMLEHRPEQAIKVLQEAAERDSQLVRAPLSLAGLYQQKAQVCGLRQEYYQEIKQPQAAETMRQRAEKYRQDLREQFAQAKQRGQRALEDDPENVHLLEQLTVACVGLNELEEASQYLDRALEMKPDAVGLQVRKAELLRLSEREEEAEFLLKSVAEKTPGIEGARPLLNFYLNQARWSEADAVMQELSKSQGGSPSFWILWGDLHIQAGKPAEAVEKYRQAIAQDEKDLQARVKIALLCLAEPPPVAQGEQIARKCLDEILALEPSGPVGVSLKGQGLGLKGRLALAGGKLDEALDHLKQAEQLCPNDAGVHFYLGLARARSGLLPRAQADFERALEIRPFFPEAQEALASARISQARDSLKEQEFEDARTKLELAYQDDPSQTEALRVLVQLSLEMGELEEAQAWAESVLDRLPHDAAMLQFAGEIQLGRRQYGDAAEIFQKLVEVEPESPVAHFQLGKAYFQDGKRGQAEQAFKHTLQLASETEERFEISVAAACSLAEVYRARGQVQLVILTISKFPADDPKCAPLQFLLGNTYIILKQHDLAIKALERAAEWPQAPPEYFHDLALAYARAGRLEEGKQKAYQQLEVHPGHPRLHLLLGIIHQMQEDLSSAEEHYRQTRLSDPDSQLAVVAANNLAMILANRGENLEEAERFALSAVSKYPDNFFYRDTLGWVYYKQEKYPEAKSNFLRAVSGLPENLDVNYHLGLVQHKLGETEEAARKLEKARSLLQAEGRYQTHPYRAEIETVLQILEEGRQNG